MTEAERHCDQECPRCLTHADMNDPAAPKMTGVTTESEIAMQGWDGEGELDIEVTMYCEPCGIAWTGSAVAVND
jgi:hypothetical protein